MHSLDWNDLRYFLAVCRAGTLVGAARSLRVRHSTVGRRVEALEAALGVSLFKHTPDGFVLSEAGSEIVPLAEEAERAVVAVERRVAGGDKRVDGIVRVTTSEAFSGFLVRWLSELQAQHPTLVVEVLSGNAALDLARRVADLAIRFVETTQADLTCRRLCDVGWSLYASESYIERAGIPKTAVDLARHDIISFDETMARSPGAIWLDQHKAGARIVVLLPQPITFAPKRLALRTRSSVTGCWLPGSPPPTTTTRARCGSSRGRGTEPLLKARVRGRARQPLEVARGVRGEVEVKL